MKNNKSLEKEDRSQLVSTIDSLYVQHNRLTRIGQHIQAEQIKDTIQELTSTLYHSGVIS